MLKIIRKTLALLFFVGITLLFLDFSGLLKAYVGWMAKIQILPAILATNAVIVFSLIIITLLFGRIYCSVICPLGVYQDFVSWIWAKTSKKRKNRFKAADNARLANATRVFFLLAFIALTARGFTGIASILAPYSNYGRIAQNLFQPIYIGANNILAAISEHFDSYAFYSVDLWIRTMPVFIISLVVWLVVTAFAIKGGRSYCNTICPVGTVLGFINRFSWLKINVDEEKCKKCGICAMRCKGNAIKVDKNSGEVLKIDYSRCVDCFDCLENCSFNALSYCHKANKKNGCETSNNEKAQPNENADKDGMGRRNFLLTLGLATAGAALAQKEKKVDGGLAIIEDKVIPERATPILPPGAKSISHFTQHCIACQLCVAECPNGVLRPSTSLDRFMQPEMSFERGYCREECHRCSDVCPTGAIKLTDSAEKVSTKIGQAHWIEKNCVVLTDDVNCSNCARHCPAGAIMMMPHDPNNPDSKKVPVIDETRCIGCGACENHCPARPVSAIVVEGLLEQHEI